MHDDSDARQLYILVGDDVSGSDPGDGDEAISVYGIFFNNFPNNMYMRVSVQAVGLSEQSIDHITATITSVHASANHVQWQSSVVIWKLHVPANLQIMHTLAAHHCAARLRLHADNARIVCCTLAHFCECISQVKR